MRAVILSGVEGLRACSYGGRNWLILLLLFTAIFATRAQVWENKNYYDRIGTFIEGYAYVEVNGKYGFINDKGEEVVPCIYDDFRGYDITPDFLCGLVGVKKGDKWGFIDTAGKVVVPFIYDDVWGFFQCVGYVKLNDKWGLINSEGTLLTEIKYTSVWYPADSAYIWMMHNGLVGYLDKNGNEIIPPQYEHGRSFSEGLAAVKKDGKWGFVDKNNTIVIPFEFDEPSETDSYRFNQGWAKVKRENFYGFIDRNGNVRLPFQYHDAHSGPVNGIIGFKDSTGNWGLMDTTGKQVLAAEFENDVFSRMVDGMIPMKKDLDTTFRWDIKYALYDSAYRPITDFVFDYVYYIIDSIAWASKDEKWGAVNNRGEVVVPFMYESVVATERNVHAYGDGRSGYLQFDGSVTIPFIYNSRETFVSAFYDSIAPVQRGQQNQVIDICGNCLFNCDSARQVISVNFPNGKKSVRGVMENFQKQGKWVYYYETGRIRSIANYQDGEEQEVFKNYSPDGKRTSSSIYKNGKREGKEVRRKPDGSKEVERYKNDVKHGKQKYTGNYYNSVTFYNEGRRVWGKNFNAEGKLTRKTTYGDIYGNYYEEYYSNGKLWSKGNYLNNRQTGQWIEICYTCTDTCGKIIRTGSYTDGVKNNDWTEQCKKKRLPAKSYNNIVRTFYSRNAIEHEYRVENGYVGGTTKYYYPNKNLKFEGQYGLGFLIKRDSVTIVVAFDEDYIPEPNVYVVSFKSGLWKYFDENRNKESEGSYRAQRYFRDSLPHVIADSAGQWALDLHSTEAVKTGEWKYYYPNGTLKEKGSWLPGVYYLKSETEEEAAKDAKLSKEFKDGTWLYYDEEGKLLKEEVHEKGKLVETR